MDVEAWWTTHPFNPENAGYIPIGAISSPQPGINVRNQYGGNIQAAIDALPSTGGTLYFEPGTYANSFMLISKSNVHFLSSGNTIFSGGPASVVGCQQALNYRDIAAGVHSHVPASIACITTNRIKNIYFKNITFDGDSKALKALNLSAANGVVFDNVTFRNFASSAISYDGVVNGNVNLENIWFRGAHFVGRQKWALYLDGAHFSGVVQSRIDFNFGDMNSSSGGLLFMANTDLNGDYNQNGTFEPNEKRNANHIVIADNTFGADGGSSMHTGLAINGANVLIKRNAVLRYIYRFVLLMGKCDALNPGIDMRYYYVKVLRNTATSAQIFTQLDGTPYNCNVLNNTMGVGRYTVRDNIISASKLPALVWESSPPIDGPNLVSNNCVGGKLYGTSLACNILDTLTPKSFLAFVMSDP